MRYKISCYDMEKQMLYNIEKLAIKPTKNATASGGSMKIHSPSLTAKMNLKTFDKARTDNF